MSKESYLPKYIDCMAELKQKHGWRFQKPVDGQIDAGLVAYHDEVTPSLIKTWRETGEPVDISIVVVVPNGSILKMPARTLGYVASALRLTRTAISEWGLNVPSLRILSPCHVNEFCDGGSLVHKLSSAEKFQQLTSTYKQNFYPDLSGVEIVLDTGKPIEGEQTLQLLRHKAEQIKEEQPRLSAELADIASKHAGRSTYNRPLDSALLPLVYLLAHPEAWGYGCDHLLFEENGHRRINLMPGSELRYLEYMMRITNIWTWAHSHQVATMLAEGYQTAPYYKGRGREPILEELRYYELSGVLKNYHRDGFRNLEAIPALQQLAIDTSQEAPRTLEEIVSQFK